MRFGDEIHEKNKALDPHKTKVRFKISCGSNPVIRSPDFCWNFLEMQDIRKNFSEDKTWDVTLYFGFSLSE